MDVSASSLPRSDDAPRTSDEDSFLDETKDNFKVIIRVRPPLQRELQSNGQPYQSTSLIDQDGQAITLSENLPAYLQNRAGVADGMLFATYRFTFDHIFDEASQQHEVYSIAARPAVQSALAGYNAAIIAYGQTGTGKTYTMEGQHLSPQHAGIVPRAIKDIFSSISSNREPHHQYLVRASYLQIYNEVISDLLKVERSNLTIREDRRRGVYVDRLSEWVVRSEEEIVALMQAGAENRTTGATKLNDLSSRSHAVFIIIVEHSQGRQALGAGELQRKSSSGRPMGLPAAMPVGPACVKVGKLNLVDLAGSERVHVTGATGKCLEESKNINKSLSALGNVIAALTDRRPRSHIPYRDSKLTRILEDSLGGNCKTTMMCMVTPALEAFSESVSTLKFANRAKNIRNRAEVNEDVDHRTLLRKYERELKRLRAELMRRSKQLVDKRQLLQVDEQRRRAEADKLAAITELENRSREFMKEKLQKRALEEKITSLQSQMLIGGNAMHVNPSVKKVLEQEQRKIQQEYESRFRELEQERVAVKGDIAQVDGFKHLLAKQRDIIVAITMRLKDRDEQILTLQEELEAYDKAQRRLEDALDTRTADLIALRKAALEQMDVSDRKVPDLVEALGAWGGEGHDLSRGEGSRSASPRIEALHVVAPPPPASNAMEVVPSPTSVATSETGGDTPSAGVSSTIREASTLVRDGLNVTSRRADEAEQRVAQLERENTQLRHEMTELAGGSEREQDLEEQVKSHAKERAALRMILDSKIRLFASEITKGIEGLATDGVDVPVRLTRQVAALQKLVGATVQAMGDASA